MPDRMREQDEFGRRNRGESDPDRTFGRFFEANAPAGGKKWEELLPKIEILLVDSKVELRAKGFSPADRSRAATELGQLAFTPSSLRDSLVRAEGRGIFNAVQNTPEDQRTGASWEGMQKRAEKIFGPGIDLGAIAEVYDQRQADDAARPVKVPEPQTTPESETEPVQQVKNYPREFEDVVLVRQGFKKVKGDTDEMERAVIHNARVRKAIQNLEIVGVDVERMRKQRDDLDIAVSTLNLARRGSVVEPEEIVSSLEFLRDCGVDTAEIETSLPQITAEAASTVGEKGERESVSEVIGNRYEEDLTRRLAKYQGNPGLQKRTIEVWLQKHAEEDVPEETVRKALAELNELELKLQQQRVAQRAGTSAFGKTEEELSQLGVEERAQRKDPVIVELERPIFGHKIPFEYGATFLGGFRAERRALKEEEAFSPERVKLLLASSWTEAFRIYNGEVTSDTKADFSALSQMEQILRTRIAEIEHTYTTAMKEGKVPHGDDKGKVFFASLVPLSSGDSIVPELEDVFKAIRTGGFNALPDLLKRMIPELKALEEMKKILAWHEAQQQLLRTIQSMRSFSTGKKIDSLAALGDQADKPLLPTSAILKIWSLEELRDKPEEKGEKISKYTEEAMRIYRSIFEIGSSETLKFGSDGNVIFDDTDEKVKFLKGLVWKHLMAEDKVFEGGYRKDVRFILNRFGPNLNVERLVQVEAFVEYLIESGLWSDLSISNIDKVDFEAGLVKVIGEAKERVKSGKEEPEIKETNRANKRTEVRLGCANAVASIHVTGLADSWARHIEWTNYAFYENVADEGIATRDKKIRGGRDTAIKRGTSVWNVDPTNGNNDRFPMVKIGGYPACTALSELVNFTDKLEGDIALGLSVGPKTLEEAIRDPRTGKRRQTNGIEWVPSSLARNFFQFTVLGEEQSGNLRSIGDYWEKDGKRIDELAGLMVNQLAANAHGSWLGSLKQSNKIRALLTATDSENYGNMFKNDQLPTDLFQSLFFGLGYAYKKELKLQASYIRGVVYAGLLAFNTGLTRQLSSAEVNKRLLDLRGGTPTATRELEYFVDKLIMDSLSDDPQKDIRPKNGAVGPAGFVVFKELVDRRYIALTKGRGLTGEGLHPAVIVNQPGGVPYAKIWNRPLEADGKPAKYPVGGKTYSLDY